MPRFECVLSRDHGQDHLIVDVEQVTEPILLTSKWVLAACQHLNLDCYRSIEVRTALPRGTVAAIAQHSMRFKS